MSILFPIKLCPAFKDYLWGGEKLKNEFNKKCELSPLAESWELSAHKDGQSRVSGGEFDGLTLSEYVEKVGRASLGENSAKYDYFPLLIKLIDAKGDLSVQVHPSDEYALSHEGEYGKTEMWYILDCDEGACLYYGFSRDVSREELEDAIKEGSLCALLNRVPVKKGDVFFIPAGMVHAIGAGIVICEIQQNSNTTYRVFDYNRRDKDGNLRPLHIEKALEVSELKKSPEKSEIVDGDDALLAECGYFAVRRKRIRGMGEIPVDRQSFLSMIVTDGEGLIRYEGGEMMIAKGDSVFVPAQNSRIKIEGDLEIIASEVR